MATLAAEQAPRRRFALRPIHWLMAGIVVIALTTAGYSLQGGAVVSYASVPEAMASPRAVQVFGYLYSKGEYDEAGRWTFDIQGEDGDVMTIVYPHTKPGNFEQAISVVAVGKYDPDAKQFMADQLLVKCPSKYQEEGQTAQG
jgi:cytochrome c-type biogenesis protein CcmE